MMLQTLLAFCALLGLVVAQGSLPDSNPDMLSCMELMVLRPHISCCEDGMVFCDIQCNQGVCRCVDPETGDVVGSGVFFDEGDPMVNCIDQFPEEPTSPPVETETDAPTDPEPTDAPTDPEPTDALTDPEPTDAPTDPEPTDAPTDPEPTDAPTDPEPTDSPTDPEPTDAPTERETTTDEPQEEPTNDDDSSDSSETSQSSDTSLSESASSRSSKSGRSMSRSRSGTNNTKQTDDSNGTDGTGGTDTSDGTDSSVGTTRSQSNTDDTTGPSRSKSKCVTVSKLVQRGCDEDCLVVDDDGCPACDRVCYETGADPQSDACANCTENQVCLRVGRFGHRTCVNALINGERCDGKRDDDDNDEEDSSSEDSSDDSTGGKRKKVKARGRIRGAKDRRIFGELSEATAPCAEGLVCTRVALGRRECRPENEGGVCVVARDTDPEFDCADDGSFEPLQCRAVGDVFVCHCVQPSSGDIIPGTEVSVADLADAPDCDSLVFQECTVESGGTTYSVPHGEYFIDVASCMRCLCENGEATLCELSVCRALSSVATGCEYNGQSYSHGETFGVGCNRCGCRTGRLECTHRTCEATAIEDRCASCRRTPRKLVCARNGKTYQSTCSAIYCAGHAPFDLLDGPCAAYDVCDLYPCAEGETCIKKGGASTFDPDGLDPEELRLCINLDALQCEDMPVEASEIPEGNPESPEAPEDEVEDTSVCGTNRQTYPSLCRLLQDTGNEGVAYAGECDREECDGGLVCGTDGVTYENDCVLRSQSGNARVDYYGECDVDEEDPQETPEGVCQRVSRVRRCIYNISNCRHLVRPEEGCCALCGGIIFVAIDFRGLGEYVKLNPRIRTIDDFSAVLFESGFISEETTSRCELDVSFTPSENLQIILEARTPEDEMFCGDESDRIARWINNPDVAADVLPPQVLQFAGAAVSAEAIVQEVIGSVNGAPALVSFLSLIFMFATLLIYLYI